MGQAALTLLGVVLGAAIAGGVSLWQVHLITAREREARKVLREQEREDTRDDFQRDAIIALHDALADYWQTILASYRQIHRLTEAERETVDSDALFVPVRAGYWRMTAARAKNRLDPWAGLGPPSAARCSSRWRPGWWLGWCPGG